VQQACNEARKYLARCAQELFVFTVNETGFPETSSTRRALTVMLRR
jgi:hypothetical protein